MQVLSFSRLPQPSNEPSFARAGGYDILDTPFRDRVQVTRSAPGDAELHARLTLSRPQASVLVHWEVAHDSRFRQVERYGLLFAQAELDYQLRVVLSGLEPGRSYWARLWAGGTWSPRVRVHTQSHAHKRPAGLVLRALA